MKLCRFTVPANPLPIVLPVTEILSPILNKSTDKTDPRGVLAEDSTQYSFKYFNGGLPVLRR